MLARKSRPLSQTLGLDAVVVGAEAHGWYKAKAVDSITLDEIRLLEGRVRVGIKALAGLDAEFALISTAPEKGQNAPRPGQKAEYARLECDGPLQDVGMRFSRLALCEACDVQNSLVGLDRKIASD